jgi:adenine/guanine phosphoribosyltransferase-like PRPP-binding protein
VDRLGGEVLGISFFIELAKLGGRAKLPGRPIHSVVVL